MQEHITFDECVRLTFDCGEQSFEEDLVREAWSNYQDEQKKLVNW